MDDVILAVRELRHTCPGMTRPALDGLDFEVRRGEIFGFLGPSGAGKTTTQQTILGLVEGWTGTIEVFARDRRSWGRALFDRIGVAFELPAGYPRLTGREDLAHFSHLYGGAPRDVGALLAAVGLEEAADQRVGSYSKGMRVRLNLARALVHGPDLLFLDEPTAGLDPVTAAEIRGLVARERDLGRTVFLTTHDMATAASLCDRVAFVARGRIAAIGRPRDLRLAHGARRLVVEHRRDGRLETSTFPMDGADEELTRLLASGAVETVHTAEASLDEVFAAVTSDRG